MRRSIPACANNDPLLGKRMSDAIADQIKIVRAKYPNAQFVTDLWQEGARLMEEGYLKIPPEVTLVWADTGYGDMQDGGKVAAGQGTYFHVAMMNGQANQLSEMVPVSRDPVRTGTVHQGRRDVVSSGEHQRHAAGGDDDARADGSWLGRSAEGDDGRGRRLSTSEVGDGGVRRQIRRCAGRRSTRNILRRPRCARRSGLPRLTSAGNAPPPPVNFSKIPRVDGDQHYHSEIRRLILDTLSEAPGDCRAEPVAEVDRCHA